MANRIFFNHIDRSEALESFIHEKTESLHSEADLNWIISKEGQKEFKIKCVSKKQVFSETAHDPYQIVNSIVHRMKVKEKRKAG